MPFMVNIYKNALKERISGYSQPFSGFKNPPGIYLVVWSFFKKPPPPMGYNVFFNLLGYSVFI